MKVIVVYYSKTGNTKSIAEIIAEKSKAKIIPINLFEKKGRGTEEERLKEAELFQLALDESENADLLFIGTSTSFKQAQSKIRRFTKSVNAKNIGLFCTFTKDVGITLTELEEILSENNITIIGMQEFGGLKTGQFKELVDEERKKYIKKAEKFAKQCLEKIKEP
ncbi:MAG: flavodoxin family protein [Candidatus Heimdallarchaeota archaeon]|nr:flavodoxin family protein [Candidatus Heimdallarchaeota archaeon]MBY8993868.1 flavodoxin family protein [Candidatus Heimdallarchaeota archaeon]